MGDALLRILKEEGIRGVFTGAGPTIIRAMSLNLGMLTSNEQAKEYFEKQGYSRPIQVIHLILIFDINVVLCYFFFKTFMLCI